MAKTRAVQKTSYLPVIVETGKFTKFYPLDWQSDVVWKSTALDYLPTKQIVGLILIPGYIEEKVKTWDPFSEEIVMTTKLILGYRHPNVDKKEFVRL